MVFIFSIKKRTIPIGNGTTNNNTTNGANTKEKKSSAKRKKGANCRVVKAKANAAPTINENTPKKKHPK